MARGRGNQNRSSGSSKGESGERPGGRTESEPRLIPDLARRALSLGLSGFFLTEETIRKALGDTVPRDWTDFLADQSERTRADFLERLSYEVAQSIEKLDMAAVLRELLEGRTLEVRAEVRLRADGPAERKVSAALKDDEEDA